MDVLFALAVAAIVLEAGRLLVALTRPTPRYDLEGGRFPPIDSADYFDRLAAVLDAPASACREFEPLYGGERFYGQALEDIARARSSIHLTAYIYTPGKVATRFTQAMAERARAGVEVRVLLDAFGSLTTRKKDLDELIRAGGRVEWYHPLRWHTWPRINNRTHLEVLVVDGEVGLVGGPGIADYWLEPGGTRTGAAWRDSMFRITGDAVAGLQAAFAENWLEADGRLLAGDAYFPPAEEPGRSPTLVVNTSPTRGGSARARMLFQLLIHVARERIEVTTPYFLPDAAARRELVRAIRERGVEVRILVPGRHSVPFFTRRCSRRRYGELLEAGARIYEYQPAMMHAKTLVVDGCWAVVGSTNFDPRSFGINDELNVAVLDRTVAKQLHEHFELDLQTSEAIDYEHWRRRPPWERATELFSAIFERQQ
ncbi:MAG: phospholipase D-like domain-containing protein [Bryobacterales bacterium]